MRKINFREAIDKAKRFLESSAHAEIMEKAGNDRFQTRTFEFLGAPLEIHDAPSFKHSYNEIFVEEVYRFGSKRETPFIVDCGCNMGLSIIYFKRLFPKARIIAFEADKGIFKTLETNIRERAITDVEVREAAVWDSETELCFNREGGLAGWACEDTGKDGIAKVKTVRLKDYLEDEIDFLKIDIEGAEARVLRDIQQNISNVARIFIEYHSRPEDAQSLHEILSILNDAGFRYHVKQVHAAKHPFVSRPLNIDMDLQLNIFGFRE